MTVLMTPDRRPFFAGTYFPKDDRGQHPGFLSILRQIGHAWSYDRESVNRVAEEFSEALTKAIARPAPSFELTEEVLHRAVEELADDFDAHFGGFGGAPKFPPHSAIQFLLAYEHAFEGRRAGDMARETMNAMVRGGIFDQIGGGMHRYATDERWRLPHFEKMLYDNALALGYLRPEPEAAEGIKRSLKRDFLREDGLLGSAMDADSEGEEGRFYLWKKDEIEEALGYEAERFSTQYGVTEEGNYLDEATHERNGLNLIFPQGSDACRDLFPKLESYRELHRARPGFDEKAVTGWNALAAMSLACTGETDWAVAILDRLGTQEPKRVAGGDVAGFLEDYAALALARLALGMDANALLDRMVELFAAEGGGFYSTSDHHESLFGRAMPVFDAPIPSANSLAIRALIAARRLEEAERHLRAVAGWMNVAPTATEGLHLAYLEFLQAGATVKTVEIEAVQQADRVKVTIRLPEGEELRQGSLRVNAEAITASEEFFVPSTSPMLTVVFARCNAQMCLPEETHEVTVR